jgi:NTE family protein
MHLATQIGELRSPGRMVETIFPVSNAEHLFGANVMDPALRPPAARAGYGRGRALTQQLTELWR